LFFSEVGIVVYYCSIALINLVLLKRRVGLGSRSFNQTRKAIVIYAKKLILAEGAEINIKKHL
jgi:hypothetical protein